MLCEGKGMHQLIYLSTIYEKQNKNRTYSNELKWERGDRVAAEQTTAAEEDARPVLTTNVMQMLGICIISMQMLCL